MYELPSYVIDCDNVINVDNFKMNVEDHLMLEAESDTTLIFNIDTEIGDQASWDYGFASGYNAEGEYIVALLAYSRDGSKLVVNMANTVTEDKGANGKLVLAEFPSRMYVDGDSATD